MTKFIKKSFEKFDVIKEQFEIEGAMTLRRIYYILLGKGLIKPSGKKDSPYVSLSKLLVKAREEGKLDWRVMVDRARRIDQRLTFLNYDNAFNWICDNYRRDSMQLQNNYVEIWIEKDAISGNVVNETWNLDVPLIVGKGWGSETYIHEAYDRISKLAKEKLQVVILYVSDFDPEGFHIPEVVRRKFALYGLHNIEIKRIALTEGQIKKFNLRKNVGFKINEKQRQKRYVRDFIKKYGVVQYEIDALSVNDLNKIIESELSKLIDFNIPRISDKESEKEVKIWLKEHYQN